MIVVGLCMAGVGLILWLSPHIPYLSSMGKLPGDVNVQRGNFSFSFPLVTCLIISIVLTILLNLIARFR
jgi:hypothetical protein